ncbi:nitroreductase family protein [Christensenellaceae bacterium OttesenSCG-928-K19]|nr:nitroreductase family protein [Christensenellaceae bacterium OttesenSCG-928-K19]
MDFFEVVKMRHSYRKAFKDVAIPKEEVEMILDAGLRAPTGGNQQGTSFVVVDDKVLIAELNKIFPHKGIASAPIVVVVLTSSIEAYPGKCFEVEDYAAAVENIMLAAFALGYASVWTDGETRDENRAKAVADLLNVPGDLCVRAMLPIGVPAEEGKQAARKPFAERVHFNRF